MKVVVTCGPSFEPIDEVRRLTNFSTGELGVLLTEQLGAAGHEVFCLKGSGATHPDPVATARRHVRRFDTNDDLLALLGPLGAEGACGAVFHAAALCDYRVAAVQDATGEDCRSAKIASRAGELTLRLAPATKVIGELRRLFPRSLLVGWKYELAGTRDEALGRAQRQLTEARTDLCVLNGRAVGPGFLLCDRGGVIAEFPNKATLCAALVRRLG